MLLSFSVKRNLSQICDKTIGEDTISTVHGLRSLSMVWIVLGHVCIVSFKYSGNKPFSSRHRAQLKHTIKTVGVVFFPTDNMEFRTVAERHIMFQLINKAAFSVDTFFFIRYRLRVIQHVPSSLIGTVR